MKNILLLSLVLASLSPALAQKLEDVSAGVNVAGIDSSANPCDDFYQYACGNWEKQTELPGDHGRWSRSFNTIDESNTLSLRDVLIDYSKGKLNKKDPNAKKLGDYYASCMDESSIEAGSAKALEKQLEAVKKLQSRAGLTALIAKLHLESANALFSFGPTPDLKNPTIYISEIDQGGYTLPDPTYYTDPAKEKARIAFKAYIASTFQLAGESEANAKKLVDQVYSIENALALASLPPDQVQDPTLLYHPGSVDTVKSMVKSFDWNLYFKTLGIKPPKIVNITEAKFMAAVEQILQATPLDDIKAYLTFSVINHASPYLGKKLSNNRWEFFGKTLNGEKERKTRWKECTESVGSGMGEGLGRAYVESHFSAQAKQRSQDMIKYLTQAFEESLKTLDWLDEKTRAAALLKLSLFTNKIGYPDQWRNYTTLSIAKDSYIKNALNAIDFESKRSLKKIGGPVDPLEWGMTPQQVNAYYEPTLNQINFPAGILQPPFFSEKFIDALNYGAIGMVIGHEMSHGFDTVGRKFDGHGVNHDWWTESVSKNFEAKASCLEKQYDQFKPLSDLHVNGHLTVTENIADNGGLKMAYIAYKKVSAGKPEPAALPGLNLNSDQLFFLSMAQGWCTKYSEPALRKQVSNNPHSPSKFRVNGPMMNTPAFAQAFKCTSGKPMAPQNRCLIW